MQTPKKPHSSPFSAPNICCLAGIVLIMYGAFLLHPAVGYFSVGAGLIAFGAIQKRG